MYISLLNLCCPILRRRVNLRNPRGPIPTFMFLSSFFSGSSHDARTGSVAAPVLDLRLCLSCNWIISTAGASVLFPFIFISIPVRSWDDSSNPLLSFISLTMGFCQSISSDFIKWRLSSDLTCWSLPQSKTGARLVIYQSTVAFFLQLLSPDLGDFLVTKLIFPW